MNTMMLKAYLAVANKIHDFKENMKKEDGMETVQAIILIVVGVVIVGALIAIVGKKDDPNSLLGKISKQLNDLVNKGNSTAG